MTTSDRAGNEERLREALAGLATQWEREAARRIADDKATGASLLAAGVQQSHAQSVRAALAATPTQSGAEGLAAQLERREALAEIGSNYTILRSTMGGIARDSTVTTLANARAVAERARAETRDWLEFDLAALRSGAEVAAAPGLSEAWAEAEAALPDGWQMGSIRASIAFGRGFDAVATTKGWTATSYSSFGVSVTEEGRGPTPAAALLALAARLTAKP